MRDETQAWDAVTIRLEVVDEGVAITGLSPTCTVRRSSNGNYLQADNSWGGSPVDLAMSDVGGGSYTKQVSSTALDSANGNYAVVITELTQPLLEHLSILTTISGDNLRRMADLHQSRFRVIFSDWDPTTKQPKAGTLYVYPSQAVYEADTVPDGTGAYGTYAMEAEFSAGLLQYYGSSKQT